VDEEVFGILRQRCEVSCAQRDQLAEIVGELVNYVTRVGGHMETPDQLMMRRARAALVEIKG